MSKGSKVAIGFVAAAVIGGGGGYALGPIADTMAAQVQAPALSAAGIPEARLEEVEGSVQVLAPDGGWVPARAGDSMSRPTCVEANGILSSVRIALGSARLEIGHEARVLLGENDASLQLDRGHVKISGSRFTTHVPLHAMKIIGSSYGVWALEDRVLLAVLGGEVEVVHRGETTKYAGGRELIYQGKTITPLPLEPELHLQITNQQKRRDERRITASVSPTALVFRKTDGGYEPVEVPSSGKLTVVLEGDEPSPGELVAFDAAGHRAHLGGTPDAVKAALVGKPKKNEAPEAKQVQKREPKKKRKRRSSRAVRRLEPLEKPEEITPPELEEVETLRPEVPEDGEPPTLMPITDQDKVE